MTQAAIYCRSSKDRAEMGLAAQRAELEAFASSKGLTIAAEFSDMEISGSLDEASRPGLRQMLAALKDPARTWRTVLALDTSRIARDSLLALYVTRECEKQGVTIHYAKMPVDGATPFGETMLAVVRAFDVLHAKLSAEKGRGGLIQNVAAGFRAGGRAPLGYKLKHTATGAIRNSVAVKKSTLVLDPGPAEQVKAFMKARAAGLARNEAAKRAGLQSKAVASLIGIERNAITYAGYQVWNQRHKVHPTREDPRKTMAWNKREEWVISDKPTHEALITRDEAERVLAAHGEFPAPRVREPEKFVLSGLLFTPDGKQWHGDSHNGCYRAGAKGRTINAAFVEGEVLWHVVADFADRGFLAKTIGEARRMADGIETDSGAIDAEAKTTQKRLANLIEVAGDAQGMPTLRAKINELETKLATLATLKEEIAARQALKASLLELSEDGLIKVLYANSMWSLHGDKDLLEMLGCPEGELLQPGQLRRVLTTLVERIELDPATRAFKIRYKVPVPTRPKALTRVKLASPTGFEPVLPL